MMKIQIPYRLDNYDVIEQAMRQNLLKLGRSSYKDMLQVSCDLPLEHPLALRQARKVVKKDFRIFTQVKEIENSGFVYEELANIDLGSHFQKVEGKIPWAREIAKYRDIFFYLESFPQEIRTAWKLGGYPNSLTGMYEKQISVRRLIKRELLRFIKGGNKKPTDTDRAKRLMVALTLFDSSQEDVLQALRKDDENTGGCSVLCQNAHAELLFVRIPRKMSELLITSPLAIRRKLFNKIERLALPVRKRMNIFGYFKAGCTQDDLLPVLKKMREVIAQLSIPEDMKKKLINYIDSLMQTIENVPFVYHKLFLDKELAVVRQMNKTGQWLKSTATYSENILKTFTQTTSLEFYPTKDYLDLYKSRASIDCTSDDDCAEEHLKSANYFSIRIFLGGKWIGNIYLLDFVKHQSVLLIDRIQVPRDLKLFYHRFFEQLSEVMQELFADVPYSIIAVPLAISNHQFLQKVFNRYRKGLKSVDLYFHIPQRIYFASLQDRQKYYILVRREGLEGSEDTQ